MVKQCKPKKNTWICCMSPEATIYIALHHRQKWKYAIESNGKYYVEHRDTTAIITKDEFEKQFEVINEDV